MDNLKDYVEGTKAVDAQSFGHLAGNAFLGRLGTLARKWLWGFEHRDALSCLLHLGEDVGGKEDGTWRDTSARR